MCVCVCVCVCRIEGVVVAKENEEILMEAWRQEQQMAIEKEMKVSPTIQDSLYVLTDHTVASDTHPPPPPPPLSISTHACTHTHTHTHRRERLGC